MLSCCGNLAYFVQIFHYMYFFIHYRPSINLSILRNAKTPCWEKR